MQRVIQNDTKQRFCSETDSGSGRLKIRANQGHSMQIDDLQLQQILNETDSPTIVHGTSMRAWERIKQEGLSRMRRNHIHFAQGEPGESGFVRGLKQLSEVLIYLDIPKLLQDGLLLFKSHNGVVLCPGDLNGLISPRYFKAVFQRSPRQQLEFDAQTDGDSNHGDTGGKTHRQAHHPQKEKTYTGKWQRRICRNILHL